MTGDDSFDRQRIETMLSGLASGRTIPRKEGDLTFEQSWEIRAFALSVALNEQDQFRWQDFQSRLIGSIQSWEQSPDDSEWGYYEHWLDALEQLLSDTGLVARETLERRTRDILLTPRDAEHQHAKREPVKITSGLGAE